MARVLDRLPQRKSGRPSTVRRTAWLDEGPPPPIDDETARSIAREAFWQAHDE
jgi:hypothetical protein